MRVFNHEHYFYKIVEHSMYRVLILKIWRLTFSKNKIKLETVYERLYVAWDPQVQHMYVDVDPCINVGIEFLFK